MTATVFVECSGTMLRVGPIISPSSVNPVEKSDDAARTGRLWATNGTASGTGELSVFGASPSGLQPTDLTVFGSKVLFSGIDANGNFNLWVTDGTAAGTSELDVLGGPLNPSGLTFYSPLYVTGHLQSLNPSADLKAGGVVTISLVMSENAAVNGTPKLVLSEGGVANYTSGSGTGILTFSYKVAAGQNTADLQITNVNLTGATVKDPNGNPADFSTVANTDRGIIIDTTPPTVSAVSSTPTSGGIAGLSETIFIDLNMSEAVTVNGTPTLKLNNGGIATYNSSASVPSGGSLEFDYTLSSGQTTSDLKITGTSLPAGASTAPRAAGVRSRSNPLGP
jgi:ELWxxDGT repeat protein